MGYVPIPIGFMLRRNGKFEVDLLMCLALYGDSSGSGLFPLGEGLEGEGSSSGLQIHLGEGLDGEGSGSGLLHLGEGLDGEGSDSDLLHL